MKWHDYFLYNKNTGELTWKKDYGRVKSGDKAGCPDKNGYLVVGLGYKIYRVHRIVWEMEYGDIPGNLMIDHIDQNTANNKLSNLRLAGKSLNALNSKKRHDNTSGCRGVSWKKDKNKYLAYINKDGKRVFIGYYDNFDEAVIARKKKEQELYPALNSSTSTKHG